MLMGTMVCLNQIQEEKKPARDPKKNAGKPAAAVVVARALSLSLALWPCVF